MWFVYELSLAVAFLLYYAPSAFWRRRLPHRGWSMRLGCYPASVAKALHDRRSLWVHAVSVGEVQAVRPLLAALAQSHPQDRLVLSTITPGGFEVAAKQLPAGGIPVFFPLDLRPCVARALTTIRPRVLLLVESELWPTAIRLAKARGVPIAVVNGRISPRAFERYRLVKPCLAGTLGRIDRFLMQSQPDADRAVWLGAPRERVRVVGSLKWDASAGAKPTAEVIRESAERLGLDGSSDVIVAGSTHQGEESHLLQAFQALRQVRRDVRLIVAPRHLERLTEVEGLARRAGFRAVRLSQVDRAQPWQVGLVDTFGELPRYYGVAALVFIGGSLIPHGGQNPLEAASLGKPMVFGPSMHNFEAITHQLLAHHAARQVDRGDELTPLFQDLLADRRLADAMGRRAQELTERFQGATQRTLDALHPLLEASDMRQET